MTHTLLKARDGPTILRATAAEVPKGTDCRGLVDEMFRIMLENDGMGLAAPQIGESVRVIVGYSNHENWKFVLINPTIKKIWGDEVEHDEGCLSVRGSVENRIKVSRPKCIKVRGFDLDWEPVTVRGTHWLSWCLQHELDHLDGKCIDRFTRPYRRA